MHFKHLKSCVNVSQFVGILLETPNNWSKYMTPALPMSKINPFELDDNVDPLWVNASCIGIWPETIVWRCCDACKVCGCALLVAIMPDDPWFCQPTDDELTLYAPCWNDVEELWV